MSVEVWWVDTFWTSSKPHLQMLRYKRKPRCRFLRGKWQILAIAVKLSTVIKWNTTLKIKVPSNLKCSSHRSMGKKILGRTYYNIRLKVKYPRHYCPHKTYFNEAVTIFFLLSLGKTINSSAEIRQTTAIKVKSIIRKEATLHHAKKQVHQFHHEFQSFIPYATRIIYDFLSISCTNVL